MINLRSVVILSWTVVWSFIAAAVLVLDVTGRLFMLLARVGWAPQVLWLGGVRVERRCAEGIDWKRPYVVVANHQSQLDIPLLFGGLPMPIRFLAKRSLFFIPVFGWSLWGARFIPVDRGSSRKARRSIEKAAERIRRGPSLVVFPEGTRTPDGALQPFKSGAFVMAVKAGVPVLPVAIRGSFDVVPKQRIAVRPGTVEVIIGAPIPTDGLGAGDKEKLKTVARERVAEMLRTRAPV
jgi:1-acyl-sn-glycerol-3-phosphate acyltransferase